MHPFATDFDQSENQHDSFFKLVFEIALRFVSKRTSFEMSASECSLSGSMSHVSCLDGLISYSMGYFKIV